MDVTTNNTITNPAENPAAIIVYIRLVECLPPLPPLFRGILYYRFWKPRNPISRIVSWTCFDLSNTIESRHDLFSSRRLRSVQFVAKKSIWMRYLYATSYWDCTSVAPKRVLQQRKKTPTRNTNIVCWLRSKFIKPYVFNTLIHKILYTIDR